MGSTIPSPRTAQTPVIGTSVVAVLSGNPTRQGIVVFNPNVTASIAISPPDIQPTINGIGTITLLPGQGIELDNWTNGLNAISSLAGQQITVYEYYP